MLHARELNFTALTTQPYNTFAVKLSFCTERRKNGSKDPGCNASNRENAPIAEGLQKGVVCSLLKPSHPPPETVSLCKGSKASQLNVLSSRNRSILKAFQNQVFAVVSNPCCVRKGSHPCTGPTTSQLNDLS